MYVRWSFKTSYIDFRLVKSGTMTVVETATVFVDNRITKGPEMSLGK